MQKRFFDLFGVLGALTSVLAVIDLIGRTLSVGIPEVISKMLTFYLLFASLVEGWIESFLELIPNSPFPTSLPDGYIDAMILSGLISASYVMALASTEGSRGETEYSRRRYLSIFIVPVFAFSLIGLSLILTVLRDALKGEREYEVATRTFGSLFLLVLAGVVLVVINSTVGS